MSEKRNSAGAASSFGTEKCPKKGRLSAEMPVPGAAPFLCRPGKEQDGMQGGICGSRGSETVKNRKHL